MWFSDMTVMKAERTALRKKLIRCLRLCVFVSKQDEGCLCSSSSPHQTCGLVRASHQKAQLQQFISEAICNLPNYFPLYLLMNVISILHYSKAPTVWCSSVWVSAVRLLLRKHSEPQPTPSWDSHQRVEGLPLFPPLCLWLYISVSDGTKLRRVSTQKNPCDKWRGHFCLLSFFIPMNKY